MSTDMGHKRPLYFIHEGSAPYPAIPSYRKIFDSKFDVREATLSEAVAGGDLENAVLWYMMGLYPKKYPARLHIHDYRSLSVGRFSSLKDTSKRLMNFKPDIRIFQNVEIEDAMAFRDNVPRRLIPVGLSPEINGIDKGSILYDFCYVGMINSDRKMDRFIQSFLSRFGTSRTIALVGPFESWIRENFRADENVHFLGRLPQAEAYRTVARSRVAVSYFPSKKPHDRQVPTKLLEYIELAMPLLVNGSPGNLRVLSQYGAKAVVADDDIFKDCPEPELFPQNNRPEVNPLRWPQFIEASGIIDLVTTSLGSSEPHT